MRRYFLRNCCGLDTNQHEGEIGCTRQMIQRGTRCFVPTLYCYIISQYKYTTNYINQLIANNFYEQIDGF